MQDLSTAKLFSTRAVHLPPSSAPATPHFAHALWLADSSRGEEEETLEAEVMMTQRHLCHISGLDTLAAGLT